MRDPFALQRLIGVSAWTERTRRRIVQVSSFQFPVLIVGPDGTGKQLIARLIHELGARSESPLIPFTADRMPPALACHQLFGHAARVSRLAPNAALGCVGAAQQGTLLIREVGALDREAQLMLLDVIKQKQFTPVGAEEARTADVRVIATSSRDLRDDVQSGRFDGELYYRLSSVSIPTLALSDRCEDVLPIARHVMARISLEKGLAQPTLSPQSLALLESFGWPGNVPQLQQAIEAAVRNGVVRGAVARDHDQSVLEMEDFAAIFDAYPHAVPRPHWVRREQPANALEPVNAFESVPHSTGITGGWLTLLEVEKQHLGRTLEYCRHHIPTAARLLGLSVTELQSRIQLHQLPAQPPFGHHPAFD